MTTVIDKRSHPLVRFLRRVRDGEDKSLLFCEGEKIIEELFLSSHSIKQIFIDKRKQGKFSVPLKGAAANKIQTSIISGDVFEFVSDLDSPQGVIALADRPDTRNKFPEQSSLKLILVLHQLQLPQNVGSLIRTAEAAGVDAMFVSKSSADPFSAKSIRGSAGSVFRVPIYTGWTLEEEIEWLRKKNIQIVAAASEGKKEYTSVDWGQPSALIVASEGKGFTDDEIKRFSTTIQIPMKGQVESLNVGTAAAICLFEAVRQGRHGS